MTDLVAGLDIGTSGARAIVADLHGDVVADATAEYPLLTPRPGWTEQHPEEWWQASCHVLRMVARQAPGPIRALGLTGQMHGSVFLDAGARVIRPALLWNDQRTAEQCAWITAQVGAERLIALTGNPALTGFQAPKIIWLRDTEPEHFARVQSVLLPKDFVRLRLTGVLATDASDAAGTLLLDARTRDWSAGILAALDLPARWFPQVHEGPDVTGTLLPDVAADLGLPAGIPVVAGGGDNAAAAVGTGVIRPGIVSVSIGTSGVVFAHTDQFAPDPSGRLHAFCHAVPGRYHLMGVTLAAGGALRWLRDVVAPGVAYDLLVAEAERVPPGADGLLFLPYLSGERTPHMDPDARGAFAGLSLAHTRAHLTRAVLEGVAFSLRDALEIMRALGTPLEEIRAVGGGARSPLWRSILATVVGAPLVRTVAEQGPAFGAAFLAAVGAGYFPDVAAAAAVVRLRDEITAPDTAARERYIEQYARYRRLYPSIRTV
ncbi:MAG: xylulokinase [Chloroflexi bacterium]|nr:MAG: xylulokinase [Chloroflexota bacterium]